MDKQCQHLIPNEQEKLLNILRKFESLFNGTLGTWKNAPLYLELTDEITLVCSRPYTEPRLHEAMFRKEFKRLVNLVVLKEEEDSEWGAPSFAKPKPKTNHVRFLSDFWNLNRQLKRQPYPMPKIRDMTCSIPRSPLFYTRFHLSTLQSCALIFSTNFQFIFTFKWCTTEFSH